MVNEAEIMSIKRANEIMHDRLDLIVQAFDDIYPEFADLVEGKDRFQVIDFYLEQAEKDHATLKQLGNLIRAITYVRER